MWCQTGQFCCGLQTLHVLFIMLSMLQVKGAPCQNIPDNDCRFGFSHFQGAGILFTCLWAASQKPKMPLSKLCSNLNSRGWSVSGELSELPFPSESCSYMGTVHFDLFLCVAFVGALWAQPVASQLQHRDKELQSIQNYFLFNQNYLWSQYTLWKQ